MNCKLSEDSNSGTPGQIHNSSDRNDHLNFYVTIVFPLLEGTKL